MKVRSVHPWLLLAAAGLIADLWTLPRAQCAPPIHQRPSSALDTAVLRSALRQIPAPEQTLSSCMGRWMRNAFVGDLAKRSPFSELSREALSGADRMARLTQDIEGVAEYVSAYRGRRVSLGAVFSRYEWLFERLRKGDFELGDWIAKGSPDQPKSEVHAIWEQLKNEGWRIEPWRGSRSGAHPEVAVGSRTIRFPLRLGSEMPEIVMAGAIYRARLLSWAESHALRMQGADAHLTMMTVARLGHWADQGKLIGGAPDSAGAIHLARGKAQDLLGIVLSAIDQDVAAKEAALYRDLSLGNPDLRMASGDKSVFGQPLDPAGLWALFRSEYWFPDIYAPGRSIGKPVAELNMTDYTTGLLPSNEGGSLRLAIRTPSWKPSDFKEDTKALGLSDSVSKFETFERPFQEKFAALNHQINRLSPTPEGLRFFNEGIQREAGYLPPSIYSLYFKSWKAGMGKTLADIARDYKKFEFGGKGIHGNALDFSRGARDLGRSIQSTLEGVPNKYQLIASLEIFNVMLMRVEKPEFIHSSMPTLHISENQVSGMHLRPFERTYIESLLNRINALIEFKINSSPRRTIDQ